MWFNTTFIICLLWYHLKLKYPFNNIFIFKSRGILLIKVDLFKETLEYLIIEEKTYQQA